MIKKLKNEKGFTLIELLVVFSVTAILATIGISSFVSYSRIQTLNAAVNDLVTLLQTAKSRAQSQVRPYPTACQDAALNGYKVGFCKRSVGVCLPEDTNLDYALYAVCGGSAVDPAVAKKNFPEGISIATSYGGTAGSFMFRVLSGGVEGGGSYIILSGYGKARSISVSSAGVIQVGPLTASPTGLIRIIEDSPSEPSPTESPDISRLENVCGNGRCEESNGENANWCSDCEVASTGFCGDNQCNSSEGEDSRSCPFDCVIGIEWEESSGEAPPDDIEWR